MEAMLGVQAVLAVLINHIVFYMGSVLPFLMVILKKGRDIEIVVKCLTLSCWSPHRFCLLSKDAPLHSSLD